VEGPLLPVLQEHSELAAEDLEMAAAEVDLADQVMVVGLDVDLDEAAAQAASSTISGYFPRPRAPANGTGS